MAEQQQFSGEDRFVASVLQFWAWAQKHTRAVVLGLIAVGIVVIGVRYYIDYQKRVRETASTELRAIRYELQRGSDPNQAVNRLRTFLVQLGGSSYAREARVLLAHSLLLENRAAEAIGPARSAADKLGSEPLSTRAAFLLAAAYEEVGDTALAVSVYEDIGSRVDQRIPKSRALESAARLRAAAGDYVAATALYEELIALTPEGDAPLRALYGSRAAELRAQGLVRSEGSESTSGETG
jgi:predicted negative regulator of RcsB-dependent stress response